MPKDQNDRKKECRTPLGKGESVIGCNNIAPQLTENGEITIGEEEWLTFAISTKKFDNLVEFITIQAEKSKQTQRYSTQPKQYGE